ncbi:hypothetical protein niasHT_008481 [Heterodera trifolii]|uniref:P-type Cu(+) transporter n=1 Tax=Heterodera trifolii TaxID=157864 RepID=A0ABD2M5I8_9BILA
MATPKLYKFHVEMTCEGCSNAVKRVLGKLEDKLKLLSVDLNAKEVQVESSSMGQDEILEVLKKTGKAKLKVIRMVLINNPNPIYVVKHLKIHGASDFIVFKRSDGTLASSPILVHFGTQIVAKNGYKNAAAEEGVPVQIAVNGKSIDGMALRTDENGDVYERNATLASLKTILKTIGPYSVQFSAKNAKGQTLSVNCTLYYLDHNAKLVISDIDGTVTKSDLRGMLLGRVWMQKNVRELYEQIKQRGYQLVYLSARPAAAGTMTMDFLKELNMPSGALLLSYEPLEKAVKTAVKDPQRVKIVCMQRLKDLFNLAPFFAGFGNQQSDKIAYDALEVPTVFMVNPKGAVTIYRNGGQTVDKPTTYRNVIDKMMDTFFPRLK